MEIQYGDCVGKVGAEVIKVIMSEDGECIAYRKKSKSIS